MNKILTITNMYPDIESPYYGIFVKEQLDTLQQLTDNNIDLYYINATKKGKIEYLKSIFIIIRLITINNYNIIHIHYGLSALFLFFFKPKAKVYLTLHGGDILKKQGKYIQVIITKLLLKKITKVFVLNNEMVDIVKIYTTSYETLPCGINTEFFKPNEPVLSNKTSSKVILFPGDPNRMVKNFSLFLKVIELLKITYPNLQVEYKCIHNVTRSEVRDLMNSADCLLMTSVSEGSPQVIKESLACNLPVVSVPVGDVSEIINNISSCYISNSHDAQELCKLVYLSLSNRSSKIRHAFLKKNVYDNKWVANKILEEYNK